MYRIYRNVHQCYWKMSLNSIKPYTYLSSLNDQNCCIIISIYSYFKSKPITNFPITYVCSDNAMITSIQQTTCYLYQAVAVK